MTLSRSYPTVKQIVDFKVNNDFYLNFNSYNDAPELEEVITSLTLHFGQANGYILLIDRAFPTSLFSKTRLVVVWAICLIIPRHITVEKF